VVCFGLLELIKCRGWEFEAFGGSLGVELDEILVFCLFVVALGSLVWVS